MTIRRTICAAAALLLATAAHADIVVGVSLSTTGPSASLGITQKNSLAFYPDTIAGEKLRLVVVDDASDPSTGTRLARKLVTEDHVDIIVGSSAVGGAPWVLRSGAMLGASSGCPPKPRRRYFCSAA